MKRITILTLFFVLSLVGFAQTFSVSSFKLLESDLTANTAGTMEKDQNGDVAALIKVVTTQTGFTFDGGALGIVKTIQKPAEVWVYVPRGMKKITVSHPQLGILRDYYFSMAVEAARTYEMVLVTGTVETTVRQARTSQYVVFQLTPSNAVVELDGELLQTVDGTASKMMKFGTYGYRVNAPDYLPEAGNITVNDPQDKHVVNVSLKPNFSQVTLKVENDAEIWVNGERKGSGSWTGNLGAGFYEFESRKANHRSQTVTRDIVVTADPQIIILQTPTPIYGEADINSTPAMADIYIDGKKYGQTPQFISDLLIGEHQYRLSRSGYADYKGTMTLSEGETMQVSATLNKKETVQPVTNTNALSDDSLSNRTFTVGGVSFTMIRIDGGTFQMGATNEQQNPYDNEKPVHQVTLSSYYIGETEVTQTLWETVMGKNPSYFKTPQRPVENIGLNDCINFIEKLNLLTGMHFRLPTEAEWEFAARGGNNSQGNQYSGSNNIDDVAWYNKNCAGKTHDVKTKHANELGIFDMSGNVMEWCMDKYGSYNSGSQINPSGPKSNFGGRVGRGGGWDQSSRGCRVAYRHVITGGTSGSNWLGLRLALDY